MKRLAAVIGLAAVLAACETVPTSSGPSAPPPPAATIPSEPLALGDRTAAAATTLAAFEQTVEARYTGVELSAAASDLRRSEFTCGAAPRAEDGRGDPPAQVCRRTVTASGCTHTWQVHLFDNSGRVQRARGLYDRRCGNDGLLGGPS